jgi:glucose/arabinose dehydrogenase
VHRFDMTGGQNYGYPFCFREYNLPPNEGLGRGTAWAWPGFLNDGLITDQQCRDNYDVPVLAMQAHSAPLGMTFYKYSASRPSPECDGVQPFPASMDGDAFIAFHGSWNRYVATGYKVVHVPVTDDGTGVVGGIGADPVDLLKHQGNDPRWSDGFRPVGVSFDACGRLLVSSDGTQGQGMKIVRIEQGNATSTPGEGFSLGGLLQFFWRSLVDLILNLYLGVTAFIASLSGGSKNAS